MILNSARDTGRITSCSGPVVQTAIASDLSFVSLKAKSLSLPKSRRLSIEYPARVEDKVLAARYAALGFRSPVTVPK